MKNIHVLPTDEPSRLFKAGIEFIFDISEVKYTERYKELHNYINQNIYITSDEEIKEGDWYISILENEVYKATKETQNIMSVANLVGSTSYKNTHFKIILTDNKDLIKDGVQAIDDEFLEWFVKNPSCEEVEVERDSREVGGHNGGSVIEYGLYEIIIPKEEPKQETLEEAADRYFPFAEKIGGETYTAYRGFMAGAKWQQERMYSEEEVKEILTKCTSKLTESKLRWFEQFKNK